MTNFDQIRHYYSLFDEQHRLDKAEGKLEYQITLQLLLRYLPQGIRILDLGGGAGKYSLELAKRGFSVTLADLSEKLLTQAREEAAMNRVSNIEGFDLVNAIDLSRYPSDQFDEVIVFGPLYHLLEQDERERCVAEVSRVLRVGGLVFASFIPYLSGAFGIVDRLFFAPDQVSHSGLIHTFETGQYHNNTDTGFQEGYFPRSAEIETLFAEHGFTKLSVRSIRSFGYGREEQLLALEASDKNMFEALLELIERTADDPSVIETCGHALYIGKAGKEKKSV